MPPCETFAIPAVPEAAGKAAFFIVAANQAPVDGNPCL
jgi:hypothetical protein